MANLYNQEYFIRTFGKGFLDKNRLKLERRRLNWFKKFFHKKNKVKILDVGCGLGYFLNLCDQQGWETFGLEMSGFALNKAVSYTKAKLNQVDLAKEPFPYQDNFFDLVTSFDVIEHLEQDDGYLKEIKRVLKKGGLAIISTPDGKSLYDQEVTHINLYTKETLIDKIKQCGFHILTSRKNRGYTKRIIPLRRYPICNWFNQRLCDLIGWYIKEIVIIMQK